PAAPTTSPLHHSASTYVSSAQRHSSSAPSFLLIFFSTYAAPPKSSTLSLHDALPICTDTDRASRWAIRPPAPRRPAGRGRRRARSEEHTSELKSLTNLVCRLLLEKKKQRL